RRGGAGTQQRGVVADAEHRGARAPREVPADDLELAGHLLRPRSSGRSFATSLSSTPFTYLWPSVPPYSLASSTASLITTRYGTSGAFFNSYAARSRIPRSTGESSFGFLSSAGAITRSSAPASPIVPSRSCAKYSVSALPKSLDCESWVRSPAALSP